MKTKICLKCKIDQPIGNYQPNLSNPDRLMNKCNFCLYNNITYTKPKPAPEEPIKKKLTKTKTTISSKVKIQENNKKYYQKRKALGLTKSSYNKEAQAKYYRENKDIILAKKKKDNPNYEAQNKYYLEHKDEINQKRRDRFKNDIDYCNKRKQIQRQYYLDHKEELLEKKKAKYWNNNNKQSINSNKL